MQFNIYDITEDRYLSPVQIDSISNHCLNTAENQWLNLTGFSTQKLEELLRPLELQSEIFKASIVPQTRPRVLTSDRALFISIPFQSTGAKLNYCSFLCLSTTLITIQQQDSLSVEELASGYQHDYRLSTADTTGLVFELLNKTVRKLSSTFFSLRDDVESMSLTLEAETSIVSNDAIMSLGRKAVLIENLFQDQQYCMLEMLSKHSDNKGLVAFQARLSLLVSDLDRGLSAVIRLQERIRGLHQYHLHDVEEATNRRLNMLTILSAIYLPPTLLTGIYGMGFENIPMLSMKNGYWIAIAMMISLITAQITFFRWRGWFK